MGLWLWLIVAYAVGFCIAARVSFVGDTNDGPPSEGSASHETWAIAIGALWPIIVALVAIWLIGTGMDKGFRFLLARTLFAPTRQQRRQQAIERAHKLATERKQRLCDNPELLQIIQEEGWELHTLPADYWTHICDIFDGSGRQLSTGGSPENMGSNIVRQEQTEASQPGSV